MFARVPCRAAETHTWMRLICNLVFCLVSLLLIMLMFVQWIGDKVNREMIEVISITNPCCDYLLIDPRLGMEQRTFRAAAREGVLSPDGHRSAVIRQNSDNGYELYAVQENGHLGEPLVIANFIADVAWSAGGSQLAFSASFGDARLIYTVDLTTGVLNQVVDELENCMLPTWSPDERYLAFFCSLSGKVSGDLYVSDLLLRQVYPIFYVEAVVQAIHWSPDGREIAILLQETVHQHLTSTIVTIHSDGSHLQRVTSNDMFVHTFVWSPDSNRLLFVGSQDLTVNKELYLIQRDGTGITQLTESFRAFVVQIIWYP